MSSRASRACSRARCSARAPSRPAIASTMARCWAWATSSERRRVANYCLSGRNAEGAAKGSRQTRSSSRASGALPARVASARWKSELAAA